MLNRLQTFFLFSFLTHHTSLFSFRPTKISIFNRVTIGEKTLFACKNFHHNPRYSTFKCQGSQGKEWFGMVRLIFTCFARKKEHQMILVHWFKVKSSTGQRTILKFSPSFSVLNLCQTQLNLSLIMQNPRIQDEYDVNNFVFDGLDEK